MRDFINYLKAPVDDFRFPKKRLGSVIGLFILIFLLIVLVIISFQRLTNANPDSTLSDMPKTVPFWFALFIPPLIEELTFRLWLKRNTTTICISFACLTWLLVSKLLPVQIYSTDMLALRCLIALVAGLVFTWALRKPIINAKFPILFYASAIVFGLVHVGNYSNFTFLGAIVVLISLATRALFGLFLGYVRIGYGIHASYLFHVANNLLPVAAIYFVLH